MNLRVIELFTLPSPDEWKYFLVILIGLLVCLTGSECIRTRYHWPAEVTRKIIHILVGVVIFFVPKIFQSAFIPLVCAAIATGSMLIIVRRGFLPSIHSTKRSSYGTVYYPLSYFVLILIFWNRSAEIISLSFLGLALGDAAAGAVGESLGSPNVYHLTSDKKSLEGSSAMFLVTSLALFCGFHYFDYSMVFSIKDLLIISIVGASVATAWEALSSRGLDNLTVPISLALVLSYYLIPSPMQVLYQFTLGIILSISIGVLSYYFKFLNASGSVATFLLASTIFGLGGWQWTVPILTFFVFSSVLSKMGMKKKKSLEQLLEKTSTRDWAQVAANGGCAGGIVVLQYFFQNVNLYPVYLGILAAVTADTWGTEIGVWAGGKTISFSSMKIVEPGTNGGFSFAGGIAGVFGSFVISLSAMFWIPIFQTLAVIILSGFAGSLVDSLLGGTIQATYECPVCHTSTERTSHCYTKTNLIKGFRWMDNDAVNWICAGTGGVVAWALLR